MNTHILPCPACGGDKGHAVPVDIDRRDGSLIERWEHCTACDATGDMEVETEPVEIEDIELMLIPPAPYVDPRQRGADRAPTSLMEAAQILTAIQIACPHTTWTEHRSIFERTEIWSRQCQHCGLWENSPLLAAAIDRVLTDDRSNSKHNNARHSA